jgi:hypothetical protein
VTVRLGGGSEPATMQDSQGEEVRVRDCVRLESSALAGHVALQGSVYTEHHWL